MEHYIIDEDNGDKSIFFLVHNFLDETELNNMRRELDGINDWKITTRYDNVSIQRKQRWYNLNNQSFGKDWKYQHDRWISHSYSDYLLDFQNKMQNEINEISKIDKSIVKPNFNSLLINYYENGNNCITAHQDDKGSFGNKPTIALLSIGGPRTFCLERTIYGNLKRDKTKKHLNKDFILPDNSLFIMAGGSQEYFCHSIKKEPENMNSRYSLTFREFI